MKSDRFAFAFFHASIDDVCALAQRVLAAKDIVCNWNTPADMSSLGAAMDQLPPRDGPPSGLFFTSPACVGWTGLANRTDDAWYSLVNAISSQAADLEALYVAGDLAEREYPSTTFEFFYHGHSVRRVQAWREEDGWHFTNEGKPLLFEDVSHYSRRAIADRINLVILDGMLTKLGIHLRALLNSRLSEGRLLTT